MKDFKRSEGRIFINCQRQNIFNEKLRAKRPMLAYLVRTLNNSI